MVDMRSHLVSLPNPMQATVVFPWIFCPLCYNSGKAWWRTGKPDGCWTNLQHETDKPDLQNNWKFSTALGSADNSLKCGKLLADSLARTLDQKSVFTVYSKPITERPCIDE
jgi:hypothetical protein